MAEKQPDCLRPTAAIPELALKCLVGAESGRSASDDQDAEVGLASDKPQRQEPGVRPAGSSRLAAELSRIAMRPYDRRQPPVCRAQLPAAGNRVVLRAAKGMIHGYLRSRFSGPMLSLNFKPLALSCVKR